MAGDKLVDGYEPYAEARDRYPAEPIDEELEGSPMFYSSGTTGRPKGIKYDIPRAPVGSMPAALADAHRLFGFTEGAVYLSPRRCTTRRHCSIAWQRSASAAP